MELQFYMVWNPSGRAPTYRHPNHESACKEAKRLALANDGQEFFVLVATDKFAIEKVKHSSLVGEFEPSRPF